jgi:hypothetical protein
MSPHPLRPLRFYELWLLRFLARSPRIDRILVEQRALPEPDLDYATYLESLYRAPPAKR